ncbi:hypothetical protein F5Y04DRAFT_118024 [Hypomontagnella monticulosa]|nr:hypothetical protein F5Y04DRAFT_118024 [Hypomontagnella monticulosa]
MSAAIAMAPSPAPHDRPAYAELAPASNAAGTSSTATANATGTGVAAAPASSPSVPRTLVAVSGTPSNASTSTTQRPTSRSPTRSAAQPAAKSSPPSASRNVPGVPGPKIIVKKEPGSPDIPSTRHRPRKLDLSNSKNPLTGSGAATARPALGREGLGIQEVGIACLSPGFVTQDPVMKEHLQQSLNVREQQRRIIEARLQQQSAKGDGPEGKDKDPISQFAAKTPGMSRRNKAPPGLSIVAPSHEQFAHERVIQSAPLGQTFTGRHNPQPLTRHLANQPSNLSSTSHIHHVPANQTANRLPPISDVFGNQGLPSHAETTARGLYPSSSHGPLASPGHPPPGPSQPPMSGRPREYKSAEEAQHELAGGRPELLPKLVHYTGHQPPTPPSPRNGMNPLDPGRSTSKRRTRAEYEEGSSPPLGHGPAATRRGPFGAGRDSPETQLQKRQEFLKLCERAWDLFHS